VVNSMNMSDTSKDAPSVQSFDSEQSLRRLSKLEAEVIVLRKLIEQLGGKVPE